MVSTKSKLTKFELFPQLPKELRNKIWRATFPKPTTLRVRYGGGNGDPIYPMLKSRTRLIALSINQESRTEALSHYEVFWLRVPGEENPIPIIISPRDTIFIHAPQLAWFSLRTLKLLISLETGLREGLKQFKTICLAGVPLSDRWDTTLDEEPDLRATIGPLFSGVSRIEAIVRGFDEEEKKECVVRVRTLFSELEPDSVVEVSNVVESPEEAAKMGTIDRGAEMEACRNWLLDRICHGEEIEMLLVCCKNKDYTRAMNILNSIETCEDHYI